jgi:hypothetical protein
MSKSKPLAGISLDLDNLWSYMKIHADSGWQQYPSYLDFFIPEMLDILDRIKVRITFFIVGKDAALHKNREALSLITKRGHEVGNHSYYHEPWIHRLSDQELIREVRKTDSHIEHVTGQKPLGFRGPGYAWDARLFEILVNTGYIYDASTFPMFLGPLARLYYFWTSELSDQEKYRRRQLYGSFIDGLRPLRPYYWELPTGRRLLEIPVTTMPIIKVPFHLSYLLYLNQLSGSCMRLYLNTALFLCKLAGVGLSFLLHPLDLIGGDSVPELDFFPGMRTKTGEKKRIFCQVLEEIKNHFECVNMSTYVRAWEKMDLTKVVKLKSSLR